jgi:hypothetical protein
VLDGADSVVDSRYCEKTLAPLLADLQNASDLEKQALAVAARERLVWLLREPDEHGYTPRVLVSPETRDFLAALEDGTALQRREGTS